ncbi:yfiH Multicopper polyphenol oxidase (laccase) [Burkholderiales bacterium]
MIDQIAGFPAGVRAALTQRGEGPMGLNLGSHVGDEPAAVRRNRLAFAAAIGARPVWLRQVHGHRVVALTGDEPDDQLECDAVWTQQPGVACTIMTADCIPVLVSHEQLALVGAAHAGWRGLAAGVIENLLEAMWQAAALQSSGPHAFQVWLGPAIGPTAFEVGPDVLAAFPEDPNRFVAGRQDRFLADLHGLAQDRLARWVRDTSQSPAAVSAVLSACSPRLTVGADGRCTASNPKRFFSFRKQPQCGRFAAAIWCTGI